MDHGNWFSGMGFLMWIILLGIPAVLVVGIWRLATQGRGTKNFPLEELKARYARGDITQNEFEQIKKDLRKD